MPHHGGDPILVASFFDSVFVSLNPLLERRFCPAEEESSAGSEVHLECKLESVGLLVVTESYGMMKDLGSHSLLVHCAVPLFVIGPKTSQFVNFNHRLFYYQKRVYG